MLMRPWAMKTAIPYWGKYKNNRTVLKDILLVLAKVNVPLHPTQWLRSTAFSQIKNSFSQKNLHVGGYYVFIHHGKVWSLCK